MEKKGIITKMKQLSKENSLVKIHIGKRMIKTAIAVYICFIIYILRGERGIPFYSAIAAILCMQSNVESSGKVAIDRIVGTLIGAFYGTIVLTAFYYKILEEKWVYIVMSVFIILVIKTSIEVKKPQMAYFSCVVFLSITANHIYDQFPYYFIIEDRKSVV